MRSFHKGTTLPFVGKAEKLFIYTLSIISY